MTNKAAQSRLKNLSNLDYRTFRNKLGGFLQRRGFSYDVIVTTINKIWSEIKN
ncbi:MAG: RecX family transcriptional regulator [Chloroflexi bacterium]|nr:RecX family transcriptional regulator [Chloroflexota bacterium]